MKLYEAIAQNWRLLNDDSRLHLEAASIRQKRINDILPSGSGFDRRTQVTHVDDQTIRLVTAFHHMDDNGMYDGWTEHSVRVKASLMHGIVVTVAGKNRNDIKEYIAEVVGGLMKTEFEWLNPQV